MKINKLRSKIAIAASLVLTAGLVATGLPSAQAAGLQPTAAQLAAWKGKEITYYFYNDSQQELDTTKAQIADFEKLTGAKVKLDVIPFTSLDTQLQARLAAGNAPDVGRLNNPGLYIKDSLDLEKYLGRKYAAEFLKGSTLQVTHPTTKKLIGVPYDLTVNGPFINVDMFKKAGVAVPTSWNWAQLIAAGKAVQKATGSEYAFAIDKSGHRVSTAMSHFGAFMVDKNQRNVLPTSKFRAEKAVKMITDLYKADQAPRDLWIGTGTKYSSPTAIFLAQQTPIFFSGNWQVAALAKDAKFDFAAVPNPKELNGGDFVKAVNDLSDYKQKKIFKIEFTEEKIKGSIHHELTHWIDDVFHNRHIEKRINKQVELQTRDIGGIPVNATKMEIQGQIHNIKQLYNKYKNNWDVLTFDDILNISPTLNTVNNSLPSNFKERWIRDLKIRMNREGLLGKNMR